MKDNYLAFVAISFLLLLEIISGKDISDYKLEEGRREKN